MWGVANPLVIDPNQLSLSKSYRNNLLVFNTINYNNDKIRQNENNLLFVPKLCYSK